MIKLFSLKQQKKDGVDINEKSGSQKKASAAQLRIQKGDMKDDFETQMFLSGFTRDSFFVQK